MLRELLSFAVDELEVVSVLVRRFSSNRVESFCIR
jgi:hypothetical protein